MPTTTAERIAERTPMELDPSTVPMLVRAASNGDPQAWEALVDRFLPMVRGIVGRFRLPPADAADVNQTVWLRLVEHLGDLREPAALPGWLATTARREALRSLQTHGRSFPVDPQGSTLHSEVDEAEIDREVLRQEQAVAVRAGLDELSQQRRELLELLVADPPVTYDEISRRLDIPIGSIGPTRARALNQLRNTEALRAWAHDGPEGGRHD
ncbi:MAG: sigma-70 family RNA polymerase sigma factor [Nocardioides sp.]